MPLSFKEHTMATPNTVHALATDAGCRKAQKAKGKLLERQDFPATLEGWQMFCDFRIRKSQRHIAASQRNVEYWTRVRKGEQFAAVEVKLNEVAALTDEITRLKAQLAAAQQPKA